MAQEVAESNVRPQGARTRPSLTVASGFLEDQGSLHFPNPYGNGQDEKGSGDHNQVCEEARVVRDDRRPRLRADLLPTLAFKN